MRLLTRPAARHLLPLLASVLTVSLARAADPPPAILSGESRGTAGRLEDARKKIAEQNWPEAIAELQSILDTPAGDDLVPVSPGHSVAARRLCHLQIARLPPEALKLYRNRVEPQARKWLAQGTARRDERLLRKVVDEAFCSPAAAEALDLLGDFVFERGRFDEAESRWRMLLPLKEEKNPPGDGALELVFPDPPKDPARVRAKQLLARLYRGPSPGWADDLKAYEERHGTASGTLGGRKGRYVDFLRAMAEEVRTGQAPTEPPWSTFGGDAARGRVARAAPEFLDRISELCREGPTYRFNLEQRLPIAEASPPDRAQPDSVRSRSLAFEPVLAAPYVIVADARYVTAYDLRTGARGDWFDLATVDAGIANGLNLKLPAPPDLRYTLTVADGCVYARLGAQDFRPDRSPAKSGSYLACLSLQPDGGGKRLRWTLPARGTKDNAVFEGVPVVADGQVFIAATRLTGERFVTAVLCYPAGEDRPSPRWQVDVCESRDLRGSESRTRHHLLTLAGPVLAYCSHAGAIVALDPQTGRRLWGVRYSSRGNRTADNEPSPRDLAPCVYAAGRLYAAPADSDHLLCLDPATGRTLWEREGIEVVHLLGVDEGRLIFTTPTGLRAVGAADGSDGEGWVLPDGGGKLAPCGRGVLIGDLVLWPTAGGRAEGRVFAVRQRDGRAPDNEALLHRVPAGNLVYSDGCLAVADQQVLSVFVAPALRLERRAEAMRDSPRSVDAALALARAETDAGLLGRARVTCERAERLIADSDDPRSVKKLKEHIGVEKQRLLLETARRAAAQQDWQEAADALELAASSEAPAPARLAARARAADLWLDTKQPERAVAAWQSLLTAEEWSTLPVQDRSGLPRKAADLAADQIESLRTLYGPQVYEAVEKQARSLYEAAPLAERLKVAQKLSREFPHAAVTRAALRDLARSHEQAGRPGATADVCRRLLVVEPNGTDQAVAMLGLARAYERQGCWEDARKTWQRLAQEYPTAQFAPLSPDRSVARWVDEHLAGAEYQKPRPSDIPDLPLPWSRGWNVPLFPGETLVPVGGDLSGPGGDVILTRISCREGYSSAGAELLSRGAATGKLRWKSRLPVVPTWAGCYTDLVIAGGDAGVCCLRQDDGEAVWNFVAPAYDPYPTAAVARLRPLPRSHHPESLASFHLEAGRLFFVQGQHRLFALDAATGKVLWNEWAPGSALKLPFPQGCFLLPFQVNGGLLAMTTGSGRTRLLDTVTGRLIKEVATPESGPSSILLVEGRGLCFATDHRHVQRVDPAGGKLVWEREAPYLTAMTGRPPRLLGNPQTLLAVWSTNLGALVQRLDWETGKPRWSLLLPPDEEPAEADRWLLDDAAFYAVHGVRLQARSLEDGKTLWVKTLSEQSADWRLLRTRDGLIAWPGSPGGRRFQFRWVIGSLQWNKGSVREPGAERSSVLCLDPLTGTTVQRLNFAAPRPATQRRLRWVEGFELLPRIEPFPGGDDFAEPLRLSREGVVVALGGEMWGLSAAKEERFPLQP
jgi:outer membrane protein assembly factor BamB/tetratricopeptide (TPR) repeat protein